MKNAFVCTSEFFKLIVNEAWTIYLRLNLSILHFSYFSSGREKETKIGNKSIFYEKKILQGEDYDNFQAAIQILKIRRKYKIIFIN